MLDGCVTNCIEREFISPALELIETARKVGLEIPIKKERYIAAQLGPYVVYALDGLDWLQWLLRCHPMALEFTGPWMPQPEPNPPTP